jgi:tetratricopeptide (TPR) repeat protein
MGSSGPGSTHRMSRPLKRKRLAVLAAAAAVLLVGGAAILWGRTRLFPDLIAEASAAYSRGEWDRTVSLVHRRLKEAPDDPRALRLAARAAARQDQDQKAITIYQRLAAGDKDAEDFTLLGRAWSRLGQLDPACREFEQARRRDPDYPAALASLAALYLRSDRSHAAAEAAQRLARQPAWEARAQSLLGTARAEAHDAAGAARALQRWRQLDPEGEAAAPYPAATERKLLARSLLMSGQPAEARPILQALLAAGPDPEVSWLLSRCFIQEGDWTQAAAVLPQASSFRTEHPLEPEPAPYVGEARCASCHRAQSDALLASRHATCFARRRELKDLPLPEEPLPDPGNPRVTHRFRRGDDSLVVETSAGPKVWRAVVDYALGSPDHYTTFVGRDDRGQAFMVRMSYYRSPRGTGWDISTGLPSQPADEEEYLGKKMAAGDGVRRCLNCHTTNFHSIIQGVGPEAADHSIGCERCHGPGGHHVAAVAAGFPDPAIAGPGAAPAPAINQICAQCHGFHGTETSNTPRNAERWLRYQSLTLTWSRCYTEGHGTLRCSTCHDPHEKLETSAARNEAKCLSCHAPDPTTSSAGSALSGAADRREDPSRDGPAARGAKTACPINPTRGCIDCHMPRIWVQATHSFKTDHYIRVRDGISPEGPADHH